jgi:phospholipase C
LSEFWRVAFLMLDRCRCAYYASGMKSYAIYALFVFQLLWAASAQAQEKPVADSAPKGLDKIGHIIVISLENHSFDNLFGYFPGADGLANADKTATQVDDKGDAYTVLPPVMRHGKPDERFPNDLPNKPFLIDPYVAADEKTGDLVHRYYQQIAQINGGKMDRFAGVSDAGWLAMGYYDGSQTKLWEYAKKYTLADQFFHAALGGSFLNHFWMICACTPRFDYAPTELLSKLDRKGNLLKDGPLTPDGYAVNTIYSIHTPHPDHVKRNHLLPPQNMPTIGDRLSEKNIDWAWYAGGWNKAVDGKADKSFQYHHQPFVYFKDYGDRTKGRAEHLKDESDFMHALESGKLPPVSFYKPLGEFNLHPGYADVTSGDVHIGKILSAIEKSPVWNDTVVIVTFDENGGYWDHVPPPSGDGISDRWGPGMRVPTLIISPFAKKGFVDHTVYDTTSILKLIETRFGLEPLGTRDKAAANLTNALELN